MKFSPFNIEYFRGIGLLILLVISGCSDDDDPELTFLDPPDPYYLVEEVIVIEGEISTFADQNFFDYNDSGKISGDGIFYNDEGMLTQSPWPNRTALSGLYYYDRGRANSILTYGHPSYTLNYMLTYDGEKVVAVDIYRKNTEAKDFTLITEIQIEYPSDTEILAIYENEVYHFYLDNGRSAYPYEYRLSHWWWPYRENISMLLTDRNVNRRVIRREGEADNVIEFSYEYNEFGYPSSVTIGNYSKFFKYSETIN